MNISALIICSCTLPSGRQPSGTGLALIQYLVGHKSVLQAQLKNMGYKREYSPFFIASLQESYLLGNHPVLPANVDSTTPNTLGPA